MGAAPMAGPERTPLISALPAPTWSSPERRPPSTPEPHLITGCTEPMPVSTAFGLVPLREFLPSGPAGSPISPGAATVTYGLGVRSVSSCLPRPRGASPDMGGVARMGLVGQQPVVQHLHEELS